MPAPPEHALRLAFGLSFEDLYRRSGLERLDHHFLGWLEDRDASLSDRLRSARVTAPAPAETSALLMALGAPLEQFIAELFGLQDEVRALRAGHQALAPLFRVKWKFVRRQALLTHTLEDLEGFDAGAARGAITAWIGGRFESLALARAVLAWQADVAGKRDAGSGLPADEAQQRLDLVLRYCAWAVMTEPGQALHGDDVLFRHPESVDPQSLLRHARRHDEAAVTLHFIRPEKIRRRQGFALTDPGTDLRGALDQANYCLWCHHQGKDSCSKGITRSTPEGAVTFRQDAFGSPLSGCPLEERISEFHELKSQGCAIGALAMIIIDNPMVAATGHRICNDCVKACVYQQQTPVDIPQAETRTLRDVLELPWGFEIYSLLTRWNPLNLQRPLPAPDSGRKVLVAGMGPAGFTLAHHLINDGHGVVGIDGLKIEPLPPALCGVDTEGRRVRFEPVEDIEALREPLDSRTQAGFGGVAEYGITVRWDKNFLKLVRLLLERREAFSLHGGVRFGGTLDVDGAFALGFDHIALAIGAGRPTVLDVPGGVARGVRTASDFLMALQLTGAARADSLANMQLRLPVVVIGGGLTAIDAATESLAYYPLQVEKFLARQEALDADSRPQPWSEDERAVAEEFIAHARALRAEREAAAREGRAPRILELLQAWGGVTIAYRKRLIDSPAYTLNHEEVEKALEEGVRFAECVSPVRLEQDADGAVRAITLERMQTTPGGGWAAGGQVSWPARSVLVAAGTQPNTELAREDPAHFQLHERHFQAIDATGLPVEIRPGDGKPSQPHVLLSRSADGRFVSFFGDLHPGWSGNVVKAMASAKRGHPVVSRVLATRSPASVEDFATFSGRITGLLQARIVRVERLAPRIVEVVVHAPAAARRFRPGQFYRLQNLEALAPRVEIAGQPTRLACEGLALTGAWVDPARGLVGTVVLEMGGSSDLCAGLRPDEPVVLMGPTGEGTEIRGGETVLLVGGGLGNAVLFSIGAAFRAAGSRVLYFAGYRTPLDRFKTGEIEAAADTVVWCCDTAPGFTPDRASDRAFQGNVVEAMQAYAAGNLGVPPIPLSEVDRVIAIGSDRMMAAVARARRGPLGRHLKPGHRAVASVNSPMQCMLKAVCGQCVQTLRDPVTGVVRQVFTCACQDQPMEQVDFDMLAQRLRQNALQEHQTARWVARALSLPGSDQGH